VRRRKMSGRGGGREQGRGGGRGGGRFAGPSGRGGFGGRGRGGGRDGGFSAGARPVEEGMRINIKQLLEDFQASADRVLALPRSGRKPVHVRLREQGGLQDSVRTAALAMCRMHAFLARLTGRGLSRCAEMAFPPNLDNHDRAVVHSECKKYGFASKSYGCAPAPHSPVDWAFRHPNQSNPDSPDALQPSSECYIATACVAMGRKDHIF
jgi:hypothetical protein